MDTPYPHIACCLDFSPAAGDALAECLTGCDVKPTATPTCVQNCERRAREAFEACRAAGGSEEECEQKKRCDDRQESGEH